MVGRDDVIRALRPIWKSKPETARRVRSRIEMILAYAEVIEARPEGSNVAGMRPVKITLGKQQRKKNHHPALPFSEAPAFMRDLRQRSGISARALELVILCAVRTGDIIGTNREDKPPMKWEHVDLKNRIWLIPSTKNDTEHRVPLSDATIKLLEDMRVRDLGEIVFPGMKADQPLSNMAMTNVIKRMNGDRKRQGLTLYADPKEGGDVTVHGFRSTFRDWAAERTNSPNEVVEMALAHAVGNKVEAAYRRGDLFEKRRRLMEEWQRFVHGSKRPQASKDMHDANRNDEFHFPLRADHSAPP
jgi:integrase